MPSAQIIQLADYRQKQRPAVDRLNEALRRWQMAAWSMDPAGTFRASCDFYSALFEDSAAVIADHEKAQS